MSTRAVSQDPRPRDKPADRRLVASPPALGAQVKAPPVWSVSIELRRAA